MEHMRVNRPRGHVYGAFDFATALQRGTQLKPHRLRCPVERTVTGCNQAVQGSNVNEREFVRVFKPERLVHRQNGMDKLDFTADVYSNEPLTNLDSRIGEATPIIASGGKN